MKKYLLKLLFLAFVGSTMGYNMYNSQREVGLSDLILANVEALASGEWCSDCNVCTGVFYVCESSYDKFWEDALRNCGGLDITLHLLSGC